MCYPQEEAVLLGCWMSPSVIIIVLHHVLILLPDLTVMSLYPSME